MRPVNKGNPRRNYTEYGQARHDLAEVIGYYCSYCEMKVRNSIEVEHILPRNQGGAPLDWENFLLSCKYCNTIKSDHNQNLNDYLWPDIDNTDLAFIYSEVNAIGPKPTIEYTLQQNVKNTIELMGLDRFPGGQNEPTESDTRWRSRKEAWDLAKKDYTDWVEAPVPAMARSIARTSLNGHYSIWTEIFKDVPMVLDAIDQEYRKIGLYKEFDTNGKRIKRQGAKI